MVKDGDVDEDTLKTHVKDNLARYKVPREIVFLDELPRNATGKVLKKDLKDYDADGTLELWGLGAASGSAHRPSTDWHHGGMTLAIGDPAPDFTLATSTARTSRCRRTPGQGGAGGVLPVRLQRRLHR